METDIEFVKLPSQKEIARRLNNLGLKDFVTKTKIDQTLGDQIEHPRSTDLAVACALYIYEDAPSTKSFNINLAKLKKSEILEAILQDHPQAIKHIRECTETAAKNAEKAAEERKKRGLK